MKKLEKMFKLLKYVTVAPGSPGLSAKTLAKLIGLSERGVYRYIEDLKAMNIDIKSKNGRYVLETSALARVFRANGDQELAFTPGVVYTEIGIGSAARVRYEIGEEVSPEEGFILDQLNSIQVHLLADGVKLEAIDQERGLSSVVVRWW